MGCEIVSDQSKTTRKSFEDFRDIQVAVLPQLPIRIKEMMIAPRGSMNQAIFAPAALVKIPNPLTSKSFR